MICNLWHNICEQVSIKKELVILCGETESDEAYALIELLVVVNSKTTEKLPVFGMIQRNGEVKI